MTPTAIELSGATCGFGDVVLWRNLDLSVERGEFVAILGANGTGKTTLLRVLLGLQPLAAGRASVLGAPVKRGNPRIGYVPQQRTFERDVPLRADDLVHLGLDGHRWGFGRKNEDSRKKVAAALELVGAPELTRSRVGVLSGGQQQRLRIALALVNQPDIVLADEPLLSLDPRSQHEVVRSLNAHRESANAAVIVVTHDINPLRPFVDRVLYLTDRAWASGTADEVITSATLTRLYGTPTDVVDVRGRLVVVSEWAADIESPLIHPHDITPHRV